MEKSDVIVSVDVETQGPVPGRHALLSLGAVAYDTSGQKLGCFSQNILGGHDSGARAPFDADTMAWWDNHPGAWHEAHLDREVLSLVMSRFLVFLGRWAQQRLIFLAAPVVFDYPFVQWAFEATEVPNPFHFGSPGGLKVLDLESFASAALNVPHRTRLPARFTEGAERHTHIALEDAIDQGTIFFRIAKEIGWPKNL